MSLTTQSIAERPPWYSVAMLSMTALAYEVLLMRLFSIIQWHHFAYMIISLALLAYGASGTFLTLGRRYLLPRYPMVYLVNALLFAFSTLFCFLISQQIQFNAEEILWDKGQVLRLMLIYLLLAMPFFFVANAVGLTLLKFSNKLSTVYAADLIGASVGSVLIVLLLFAVMPNDALKLITLLALLAAALASWELYQTRPGILRRLLPVIVVTAVIPVLLPASWMELQLSPYKGLSQTLRMTGANAIRQDSSPLGLITVVNNPVIPFRHTPGLSLNASMEPPEQLGVFIDADGMTAITQFSGHKQQLAYLDEVTSALPYHLSTVDDVLILGAGGGAEVLQAHYHDAEHINAVELDNNIIKLVREDYQTFAGNLYGLDSVDVVSAEARGFVADNDEYYDLIQLALVDSYSAASAGLYALSESYLYTVEALQDYLLHLKPQGYLAISRWIKLPPRDTLKLLVTAVDALRELGVQNPQQHIVLIRSLQTSTLIVKNSAFTAEEISAVKNFCDQRSFDVAYYPSMPLTEANRFNRLAEPMFYNAAISLLGNDRENFMQRYKFNLNPATDNRPFFFQFFKWSVLPEILSLKGQGGMPLLEWGYLILVATLFQALIASFVLILLPLLFHRRDKSTHINPVLRLHSLAYFTLLGLAFLFIEIAFIQKFILFLHHPIFAVSVVLAAFLLFAGLGSYYSTRFCHRNAYNKGIRTSVIIITVIGLLYILVLDPIFLQLMALPAVFKIVLSVFLIAPLAFGMGMPFPLGLSCLSGINKELVPWVWGVNGCASVLSAVLATLLAIHFGFTAVILTALSLYLMALLSFNYWHRIV